MKIADSGFAEIVTVHGSGQSERAGTPHPPYISHVDVIDEYGVREGVARERSADSVDPR
jgi:hypothetical protein